MPRSVWAGVAPSYGLLLLQAKTETVVRRVGCPVAMRKFVPHVTLGRFQPPSPPEALRPERAVAMGMSFRTDPWPVTEMTLWRSHLIGKSPHYKVLARYPFGSPA